MLGGGRVDAATLVAALGAGPSYIITEETNWHLHGVGITNSVLCMVYSKGRGKFLYSANVVQ